MVSYYATHRIPVTQFEQPGVRFGSDEQVVLSPATGLTTPDGEVIPTQGAPGMTPLAPDFRTGGVVPNRTNGDYNGARYPNGQYPDGSGKQHQKKSGGIGHFLHKIIGAFGQ